MPLGDDLLDLLRSAEQEVLLVAPYMKLNAATRLLGAVKASVSSIKLVTRWKPEEVAAGVSDLEVFDLVSARPGAGLFLHPCLHAKFYRADVRCLVGSANLTSKALGWAIPSNLELLLAADPATEQLRTFERELMGHAAVATKEIRDAMATAAALLPPPPSPPPENLDTWLPTCPQPQWLYNVYAGTDTYRLVGSSEEAGRADLAALEIPQGLGEAVLHQFVTATFIQMPMVQRITQALTTSITDADGARLLASLIPEQAMPYGDATIAWETMKRWLQVFGGGNFRARPAGEELVRSRTI